VVNFPAQLTNVVAVAAGYEHALALQAKGTVVAWGANYDGQTNTPPDLTNAVAIASGDFHSLALRANGTVAAWGSDDRGQTNLPVNLANIVAVGANTFGSLAVTSDGQMVAWGNLILSEVQVPPDLQDVVDVASGESHFVALRADGTVVAWGDNSSGQTNVPVGLTNAVRVAAWGFTSVALTADGKVVAWGDFPKSLSNALAASSNVVAIAGALGSGQTFLALIGSGPPNLSSPLVNRSVAAGSTTSFRASVTGLLPFSFQWQFEGKDLPGATNPVLTLVDVQPSQAGDYSVTVGNAYGLARSDSASMTVAPLLLNGVQCQPFTHIAYAGSTASFNALAQGLDLRYQWFSNGVALDGATNSTLTLVNVQLTQTASYSLSVSNSGGRLSSADIPLQVVPILINYQPSTQTNYAGGSAVLAVYAAGSPPLSYQWTFGGLPLAGATNSSLSLNALQFTQAGLYSVSVSNAFGSTNCKPFYLSVQPLFASIDVPGTTHFQGEQSYLGTVVRGTSPVAYQWFFNGVSLPDATNDQLLFPALTPAQSGSYFVVVTNVFGAVTSAPARLAVINLVEWQSSSTQAPTFLSIPAELTSVAASSGGWGLVSRADGTIDVLTNGASAAPALEGTMKQVLSVAAGRSHGLALRADGTVSAWGDNSFGQTVTPTDLSNVVSISAGDFHNLALKADGSVVAWGNNNFGQTNVPSGLTNVAAIGAGTNASWALTRDGRVFGWGADATGVPIRVPLEWTNISALAAGNSFVLALKQDASVSVWQSDSSGPPDSPPMLTNIVALAANGDHDLELRADGTVVSWAYPNNGPTGVSNVVALAAGGHDWALLGSGPPVLQAALTSLNLQTNGFSVSLPTKAGKVYALEYSDSLSSVEWKSWPLVAGNGQELTFTDPSVRGAQRFYRVRQW